MSKETSLTEYQNIPTPLTARQEIETGAKRFGPFSGKIIEEMRGSDGMAFRLQIFFNGEFIAEAHNDGCGGMTSVDFIAPGEWKKFQNQPESFGALREQRTEKLTGFLAGNAEWIPAEGDLASRYGAAEGKIDNFADALYSYAGCIKDIGSRVSKGTPIAEKDGKLITWTGKFTQEFKASILAKSPGVFFFNDHPVFAKLAPVSIPAVKSALPSISIEDKAIAADILAEFDLAISKNAKGCYVVKLPDGRKFTARTPGGDIRMILVSIAKQLKS